MCGIAGYSLSDDVTRKPKSISRAMLLGIEHRGQDATGFAFRDSTGAFQVHKAAMRARDFVPKRLCVPRSARTVIMHTRFATQGSEHYNDNNHPIYAGHAVGVHNGHVYNDDEIFKDIEAAIGYNPRIAEVDSEAIFSYLGHIDADVTDALAEVVGGAAIAWMDDTDEGDVLHLARIHNSPLVIASTEDGSLFFASTEDAVLDGINAANLVPKAIREVAEGTYLKVVKGEVVDVRTFNPHYYNYYSYTKPTSTRSVTHIGGGSSRFSFRDSWDDEFEFEDSQTRQYEDWWQRNLEECEAAIEADGDSLAPVRVITPKLERFVSGPFLNAQYLFDLTLPLESYTEEQYIANSDNRIREDQVIEWMSRLKMSEDKKFEVGENMHAFARPGDPVVTKFHGDVVRGHLYKVPPTFPHGDYVLRLYVPNDSRNKRYESVFVSRKQYEFDIWVDSETLADDFKEAAEVGRVQLCD